MTVHVLLIRLRSRQRCIDRPWLALPLAASLFIPVMAGSGDGPARWLVFGSTRLYLAPVVLPVALLLLAVPTRTVAIYVASVTFVVLALMLQPDASQLTACALALLVLLATDDWPRLYRLALPVMLLGSVVATWRTPDPLLPVRYVEGVFHLAADVSPLALAAAVLSAALPVAALAWVARVTRSWSALAVAVFFGSLFALAPLQVTPVPLLGFGSGPICGYFIAAGIVMRQAIANGPSTTR